MRRVALFLAACAAVVSAIALYAQQPDSLASINNPLEVSQSVPRLIMFSGTLKDLTGKPLTGPVDLNFAIYKEQADAAPLWQESQTLNVDEQGHYTAILGAMQPEGLPVDLFTSGQARWLGVSVGKLAEQPRVLLVSVPYALKAGDAEMLAGKPASAYALAQPAGDSTSSGTATAGTTNPVGAARSELAAPGKPKSGPKPNVTGTGTQNYIPLWTDSAGTLGNSVMFQSSGLVGVGTATPGVALDVYGASAGLRLSGTGTHQVTITGATSGRLGQDAAGFFFSSDTKGAAIRFGTNNGSGHEWMRITSAGKIGIGTTTPAHALDVVGDINASTNLNAGGNLSVTGTITGNGSGLTNVTAANALLLNGYASSAFQPAGSYAVTTGPNSFTGNQTVSNGNVGIGTASPPSLLSVGSSSQFQVNSSGIVTAYGGEATAGNGLVATVASADYTNQTATIGPVAVYTVPTGGGGLYLVMQNATVHGTGTGKMAITYAWTDQEGAKNQGPDTMYLASSASSIGDVFCWYLAASSTVTYTVTYTATGSYDYSFRLVKIK